MGGAGGCTSVLYRENVSILPEIKVHTNITDKLTDPVLETSKGSEEQTHTSADSSQTM